MEIPEKKNDVPSRFELQVLKELNEKKQQTGSDKINSFLSSIPQPFIKAGEWLKKIPGLDKIADNTKQAVSDLFQNFQSEKFSFDTIIEKYKDSGYVQINNPDDISTLDLEDIEPLIGDICKKYQTLVSEEESDYSSAVSLHGVPKDVVALINLNRKAVNEYAAHYGFDISLEKERLFALNILEYAASENEFARKSVMERLVNQTKNMTNKEAKEDLDKTTFLSMFSTLTSSISIKLLKAKVGGVIPINGAVIGNGFNAYFTSEVCSAAQFFYKQRFLIKKYGVEVIDLSEKDLKMLEKINKQEKDK
ncbi:EcsC family protein [Chondrinema litorale]|uniref:EcsC family protein n=1 Tax=Chondrinema litorale TaxID=2994555 RepID=UPI00254346A0|nr:EcsC family protein [Chondrinema litorale]UZR92882.1 EcsC family protein [Chondrinema litorale]